MALARHLDSTQRAAVLANALAAAKVIAHQESRAHALAALAQLVAKTGGEELMVALLDTAASVKRCHALSAASQAVELTQQACPLAEVLRKCCRAVDNSRAASRRVSAISAPRRPTC
jgi:hypothetical protein